MASRTGGGDRASAERPARMFERREAERMLRLYTRLWGPRNAGPDKPRTWPTDPALARAITDWRAHLGLLKMPLPALVVSGSGPDCYACVLAGLWSGEGAPPQGPTLTKTPALAATLYAIADEYAEADVASAPGDTSWRPSNGGAPRPSRMPRACSGRRAPRRCGPRGASGGCGCRAGASRRICYGWPARRR